MKATKSNGTTIERLWPVEGPFTIKGISGRVYLLNRGSSMGYLPPLKAQAECDRLNLQWRADRMGRILLYLETRWCLASSHYADVILQMQNKCVLAYRKLSTQLYIKRYNLTNTSDGK